MRRQMELQAQQMRESILGKKDDVIFPPERKSATQTQTDLSMNDKTSVASGADFARQHVTTATDAREFFDEIQRKKAQQNSV